MIFISTQSKDTYIRYELGEICNLTISNDNAVNVLAFSSNGNVNDLALLYGGETETFLNINIRQLFIKSNAPGAPCNFRVSAW